MSAKNYLLKISAVQGVGVEAGESGVQSQPLLLDTMFQKTKRNKERKTLITTTKLKPTSSDVGRKEPLPESSLEETCVPTKDAHKGRLGFWL